MSLTGTKKEAEARVTALVSPNGENEPALPGRRTPKPTAKRLAGSWEGDESDEGRPLGTKQVKGSSGAAANSDLVTRAANAARVTELLSLRQPQNQSTGPDERISPTPPKNRTTWPPFPLLIV